LAKEFIMSKQCGDTARFNRIRKQNTARRLKVRELQEKLALAPARSVPAVKAKPPEEGPGAL
jgi:hypothetical protein